MKGEAAGGVFGARFPKWEFWEVYLLWGIAFGDGGVTLF